MAAGNLSVAAAAAFAIIFGITTFLHLYQLVRTKTWFWIAFLVGGIFETFGFAARISQADNPRGEHVRTAIIVSTLGILLAPILFAASLYMMLGRIIRVTGAQELSMISPRWLTKVFLLGDIVSFLIQVFGATLILGDDLDKQKLGEKIILVGLYVQIVFFIYFITNVLIFWKRVKKAPKILTTVPWTRHLIILLLGSSLVLLRSIFRLVEYHQGSNGSLINNEAYMYCLDAGPMLAMMLMYHFVHPSGITSVLNGTKVAHFLKIQDSDRRPLRDDSTVELVGR